MRFDKALASQGFGSRKGCRALIERGAVQVNGVVSSDPDAELSLTGLVFTIDGREWPYAETLYVMLNKPAGTECSHLPTHHQSVFSLLPTHYVERGVQCVGRLDAETTGLLFLSDDGSFVQRLTSPKHHVPKTYLVRCAQPVTDEQLERLRAGVMLSGDPEPARAVNAERHEQGIALTIDEGRYHQVRRMFAAVGNHVEGLHRLSVGSIVLPDSLAPGESRLLTAEDVASLTQKMRGQGV